MASLAERIQRNSMPEPNTGCWLWVGRSDPAGYGLMKVGGKAVLVHRLSYTAFVGPIQPGMCVCHRCDTPPCVSPFHLFLGTRADNIADMVRKGRDRRFGSGVVFGAPIKRPPNYRRKERHGSSAA